MIAEKRVPLFRRKYEVRAGGCWEWTAARLTSGYGAFFDGRGMTCAHRVSYELSVGRIPRGQELDHLCRNKLCVNPTHLEAVTHSTNVRRVAGSDSHCRRGHLRCPENALSRADGAYACRLCHRISRQACERRRRQKHQ